MGKALYREYRPKSLSEIIGQEHITQTLEHALQKGMISHAYLFTGPRGTGKTSIARILAHEVNGLPYSEQSHLDIIEIDAASNRRIDEIRELKERVHTAPTSVKYKVYIIDEVHMLTKEAFNALLKTLEEPPDHVIFILATTEVHKVPETIISRTQRFTFKPVEYSKVAKHLKQIAKKEKVSIDDDALELIAVHGEGSFRDSISLLDQVRHTNDHITLQDVQQAVGQAPTELLSQLLGSIRSGKLSDIAASLAALQSQGIQSPQVARQLSQLLRGDILNAQPLLPIQQTLSLLNNLVAVGAAQDPSLELELAIYAAALTHAPLKNNNSDTALMPASQPTINPQSNVLAHARHNAEPQTAKPPHPATAKTQEKSTEKNKVAAQANVEGGVLDADSWAQVLATIKTRHNTLYGITRMAVPTFEPGKLTLHFAFAFHQKRLDDSKNKQVLTGIILETTGQAVSVTCLLDPKIKAEAAPAVLAPEIIEDAVDLQTISNIFGSAEVVE